MRNTEHGLVEQYLTRVCQIAVRAEQGQDVSAELAETIREAHDHFLIVQGSDPASTLEYFIGQLRFKADRVHPSQPAYSETLRNAATLAARATTAS